VVKPIFNWQKVNAARKSLAQGFDVGDISIDWLIDHSRLVADIQAAADLSPSEYRDVCCATLVSALPSVFDPVDIHKEHRLGGGRVDLRMGFDQNGLDAVPSLRALCEPNHARCLLVEVKHEAAPVGPKAVNQLAGYLTANPIDPGVGILLSSSGVTSAAINQVISYRRLGTVIVPLQHTDLLSLARAGNPRDAARHIRRRSAMLSAA
jgi:hypothetical protein